MKIYKNISGLEFIKLERNGKMVTVKFLKLGAIVETYGGNLSAGKVRDPLAISYLGVGYLGYFDKKCEYHKRTKTLWNNMIKRCYEEGYSNCHYTKTVVCDRWLCYENFQRDVKNLDGFDRWASGEKMNLDKDIIGDGTLYSPETCSFVTEFENKSLGKKCKKLINGRFVAKSV